MNERDNSFLGRGWAFPPAFNRNMGIVEMVEQDSDIKESLRIIIGTIPGERVMFPQFGCNIRKYVFEVTDPTHISMMKDTIYAAILDNEPRVKIDSIEIHDDSQEHGLVHIHLNYTIITTNTRSNMVYPFYFKEGTNL